jgi:FkbM family methyltransferase
MDKSKRSYSQSGEDIIIDFIFDTLEHKTRRYLDVGAHDPIALSNTYYFYKQGHYGVFVEPDPDLYKNFKRHRPEDKGLNVGVGSGEDRKESFYLMEPSTLNTFSKHESEVYQQFYSWVKVRGVKKIKLIDINKIFLKYFRSGIDLLSVDTEGMDFEIIQSIDFESYRPVVVCVETAVYVNKNTLRKHTEIIDLLKKRGYFVYADTFVNTIFVDRKKWEEAGRAKLEDFS